MNFAIFAILMPFLMPILKPMLTSSGFTLEMTFCAIAAGAAIVHQRPTELSHGARASERFFCDLQPKLQNLLDFFIFRPNYLQLLRRHGQLALAGVGRGGEGGGSRYRWAFVRGPPAHLFIL